MKKILYHDFRNTLYLTGKTGSGSGKTGRGKSYSDPLLEFRTQNLELDKVNKVGYITQIESGFNYLLFNNINNAFFYSKLIIISVSSGVQVDLKIFSSKFYVRPLPAV